MKTENKILMQRARESLSGKWGLAVGTFAFYILTVIVLNSVPKVGGIISLVVLGPVFLGLIIFTLALSRNTDAKFEQIFVGFQDFQRALVAYLWRILFILLWALLFIIPGIVAAIAYSQTFFILADDKSVSGRDAVKRSKQMMYGYKWKYFCLQLRFLGWALLSILSVGIGFLWLLPYMQVSYAKFYDDLKPSVNNSVV
jgi:uncharacterized membrane protein